ncbi:MAG TPA: molybdenum cofactor guanylyltransferase [Pseudobdellovibrionaceae bacterium]|jgi:molybdopterin-guanine dinucleotide biosynthesis protein A
MAQGTNTQPDLRGVFGVVLAGGKSSRMGSDKALLSFKGGTLLEHQFKKLSSLLGVENVIVSGNYPPLRHRADETPELGPLGGISSLVREFPLAEFLFFLPVDMPNLSEKTLLRLLQAAQRDFSHNSWSLSHFEMPLILRNNAELKLILKDLILQPRNFRSVRRLCELLKHTAVDTTDILSTEFLNTNTLKEWEEVIDEHTR